MSNRIESKGLDAMIDALGDVTRKGVPRAQRELDQVLDRTAEASRDLAHVSHDERHSGALKASQSHSSDHGSNHWLGRVAYTDRGAPFEMQRGGEHARFIDDLSGLSVEDFTAALDAMFKDL